MASDVVNRETIRDAFTTLLSTALVGTGLPVQAVYGYKKADFQGQSPVVVIAPGGTGRGAAAFDKTGSDVYLDVFVFVLYSDCLLYTSPSPRDATLSRMPSSA